MSADRPSNHAMSVPEPREGARLAQILDHFLEDDSLNVYAGELEVRPPGAPTVRLVTGALAGQQALGD
jgi:hypothetical protein